MFGVSKIEKQYFVQQELIKSDCKNNYIMLQNNTRSAKNYHFPLKY